MRLRKSVRQYWPLVIVTVALVLGLPFISTQPVLFKNSREISAESDALLKSQAGFIRPAQTMPFYGFDSIALQTPLFKSWWDGKNASSKLLEVGANTVFLGSIWKESQSFKEQLTELRRKGLKVAVQVTEISDWIDTEILNSNTFSMKRAAFVFAQARNQGVERYVDFILVGSDSSGTDVLSYATQEQRQKMYRLAKEFFPNTPIIMRYGSELENVEAKHGQKHPRGWLWDEYRFGEEECDIALISPEKAKPSKIDVVLEKLNQAIAIVKSRSTDTAIVVIAQFNEEKSLSLNKLGMWSMREIDQFVTAVLTNSSVDGLLFRGLGNHAFDLAHPDFIAEREAVRKAAPLRISIEGVDRSISAEK